MPIVVDPGFAWPPVVDPVVSPDGKLTAIVDPAHAGVLLRADFDDSVPDTPAQPEKVLATNFVLNPPADPSGALWRGLTFSGATATDSFEAHLGKTVYRSTLTSGSGYVYLEPAVGYSGDLDTLVPVTPGEVISGAMLVARSYSGNANLRFGFRTASGAHAAWSSDGTIATVNSSDFTRLVIENKTVPANAAYALMHVSTTSGNGEWVEGTEAEIVKEATARPYFDGASTPSGAKRYRWTGTANASASEEYTPATPFVPGHGATTAKVRFERQDGTVVRSGNPAWAPGGYAHSYDHEATLGGGTLWRAVPIRFDGTEGTPSEYVGAVIPALTDGWAWLKPVTDPDKAMLLKVEPPDLSYDGRVDTTSIAGAPRPAATWDVLEGFTTQLRSLVREKDVEQQLMALLDEGPVLAQFPACAGLPDFYFIRGKLDLEHVHWDGWPWRRYQWDVIQVDRPDTTDSPLRIPGLSYDTVARDWTTYDQLKSTVESYNKLLEP